MPCPAHLPLRMKKEAFKAPKQATIQRVHELLKQHYGSRKVTRHDPLAGLVLIILSQATNNINCDRAFTSLKTKYPGWYAVLQAPVEEVANAIRSGVANRKAAPLK
jgi:endonuclease-3